jgi:hypothetical protein
MSDVFSFRLVRGPQRYAQRDGIPLYVLPPSLTARAVRHAPTLLDDLVSAADVASRHADSFVNGPSFVGPSTPLPVPLRDLDRWLNQRRNRAEPDALVAALPAPPATLVASADWRSTRRTLADSLVAAIVTRHRAPSVLVDLHRLLMLAALVEALAQQAPGLTTADAVAVFLRSGRVLLPPQILGLMQTNARLARRYGFSELTVVRDDWYEYRFGEIAHVENVLAGEVRERSHRRLSETETIESREEVREVEESSDVEKTDRFEMSSSASQDMSLKASVEATVDVSAEYPSTTVDVHAGGSFDYSQEQAREQATKLAQETIARAVKRVQDRVTTARTTRTLERFEESNLHRFENVGPDPTTFVSIYRWIDKIQRLQAFHYPHRFLLELQVPEPAAFVHWRRKKPPVGLINPPPPEFVTLAPDGMRPLVEFGSMRPLAPTDITPQTYLQYARRYRIGDIEQSPRDTIIKSVPIVLSPTPGTTPPAGAEGDEASVADPTQYDLIGGGEGQSAQGGTASAGVQLDEGYRLGAWSITIQTYTSLFVTGSAFGNSADITVEARGVNPLFKIAVGQVVRSATPDPSHRTAPAPDGPWSSENVFTASYTVNQIETPITGQVPVTVWARTAREFRAHLALTCYRMPSALTAWQLRVYQRLAAEFRSQEVRYLEELAARAIGSGVQIAGDSPMRNKEVMREELKRAAIRLLSNGTYPPSNLRAPDDDPDVGPVFDLDGAALTAGEIQFIEQAFEWENMTFVFYPYFWTGMDKWAALSDVPDGADPQFARFLRSGSARVVVPARPGFESQVQLYVDTGVLWGGGPVPAVDDPEYLSVAEEIRVQTGAAERGEPGDWWDVKLPTALVAVDTEAQFPVQNPAPAVGPPPQP